MKEMMNGHAITQGGSVKKTLFVVALATMLVFAVAGTAFAVNHSGTIRPGLATTPLAEVNGVPTAGAGTWIYNDWDTSLGTNATDGNSPHGNYTTTTVKCAVCHAVHYAAPGVAPVGDPASAADTLLRMKASDACIYCHATAGQAVNGRPVYGGLGTAITAPGATGGNTTTGHVIGTNCDMCHSSVHGANADNSVLALNGYLLKLLPQTAVTPLDVPTADMLGAIEALNNVAQNAGWPNALPNSTGDYASVNSSTLREEAVGVFCAECHNGAYAGGSAGASTNVLGSGSTGVQYTGHRIAAAATTDWNAAGDMSSGSFSGTIAWAAAANCKSCHDATDVYGDAFPHSWGGTKMWLTAAPFEGGTPENLPYGPGTEYNVDMYQLYDGVCLKCHVANGGTEGVGITF
jgi:hypothetical protein